MRTILAPTLLLLSLLSPPAPAQWPTDPAQNLGVCTAAGDQGVPRIATAGDGSTWIAWFDNRSGSYAVYAQKLDAAGNAQFAPNGLLVSAHPQSTSLVGWGITDDGEGGCVLVFTDLRAGGDLDVYAYRLDGAGNFVWGPDGVPVSSNGDYEANPAVTRLTNGWFAVSWVRTPNSGPGAIHHQRLSPSGVPTFPGDGLSIVGAGSERPGFCDIVPAADGGWILCWVRDTTIPAGLKHVRAQRIDNAGIAQWNGGSPLAVYDAASVPIAYQPVVLPDGAGGAVFAWHVSVGAFFESRIQRVTSAGAEVHAHNGVLVTTEASRSAFSPAPALVPGGDVIVAFNKRNSGQSQWASCVQRIDGAGARLWTDSGVELLPYGGIPKQFERCVPYGDGAIVLSFEQTNYPAQGLRALAFRVDAAGASVWGAPRVLSSVLSGKDKPGLVIDASGIARAVWDDNRSDSGDIYAQNVNGDGTLGPLTPGLAYCLGDGSATACPCGNASPAGAPAGCLHSFGQGARLALSGLTSLANDTAVLAGSQMPSAPALYFQGTARVNGGLGSAFGDGLRCAGGIVVRLKQVTNATGSSQYPAAGDPPLSVRGLVTAPGTRTYQVWYRNTQAFCTPDGWNLSNGVEAIWFP
jgi:hypothetical protein